MVPATEVNWWWNGRITTLISWLNDPEIMKYSENRHRKHTEKTQFEHMQSFSPYWVIFFENKMIGTIRADVDWRNDSANLGILVGDSNHHGKGLGTEAWITVMKHLALTGTRKVEAGMMAENHPMIGLCRSCGMVEEGRLKGHFLWNEQRMDLVLMGAIQ